jgi:hypothetical protein
LPARLWNTTIPTIPLWPRRYENVPRRGPVKGDAITVMNHYTPAEHRLLDDADRFVLAETKLVEPETAAGLEIHPAYLHVDSERAGS